MSAIPPYGWAAEHDPILTRITESVTDAIVTLAANLPTDANLADVRARLLSVESVLSELPEGYDDAPIRQELAAVAQALGNAASADALASAVQQLEALQTAVGNISVEGYDDTALVAAVEAQGQRLATAEETLAQVGPPYDDSGLRGEVNALTQAYADAAGRLAAAEAVLENLPEGVDLTPIQTEIAQLKARLDAIDGFVNRPPTSSPIPPQALTVGVEFAADFSGYFDDPDGHVLNAAEVSGTLPPGITQDGFLFSGTPTQAGTFTTVLAAADLYAEQASRSIAWTVSAVGAPRSVKAEAGGYTLQSPGKLTQVNPVPAVGGYTLEFV